VTHQQALDVRGGGSRGRRLNKTSPGRDGDPDTFFGEGDAVRTKAELDRRNDPVRPRIDLREDAGRVRRAWLTGRAARDPDVAASGGDAARGRRDGDDGDRLARSRRYPPDALCGCCVVTQTPPSPAAIRVGALETGIRSITVALRGSIRATVFRLYSATQTLPYPIAMPPPPTPATRSTSSPVAGSCRTIASRLGSRAHARTRTRTRDSAARPDQLSGRLREVALASGRWAAQRSCFGTTYAVSGASASDSWLQGVFARVSVARAAVGNVASSRSSSAPAEARRARARGGRGCVRSASPRRSFPARRGCVRAGSPRRRRRAPPRASPSATRQARVALAGASRSWSVSRVRRAGEQRTSSGSIPSRARWLAIRLASRWPRDASGHGRGGVESAQLDFAWRKR
jgi:hypothetical protein